MGEGNKSEKGRRKKEGERREEKREVWGNITRLRENREGGEVGSRKKGGRRREDGGAPSLVWLCDVRPLTQDPRRIPCARI